MGMSLVYRRLSDEQRKRLETDPPFAASLFPADIPPPMPPERATRMKQKMRPWQRIIFWLFMRKANNPNVLSVDKSWHTIHYLLTGEKGMTPRHVPDNPLHNVVMGGTATPIDGPYGPVRVLEKADVAAVADALTTVNAQMLREKYSISELNAADTYATPKPGGWSDRELEMVFACIPSLQEFFRRAAAARQCVGIALI